MVMAAASSTIDSETSTTRNYPRLWHDPDEDEATNGSADNNMSTGPPNQQNNDNETLNEAWEDSFLRARRMRGVDLVSLSLPTPERRSLWEISANSLVVGQEVALSCLLLAGHRVIVANNEWEFARGGSMVAVLDRDAHQWVPMFSIGLLYLSFMILVYYRDIRSSGSSAKEMVTRGVATDKSSDNVSVCGQEENRSGIRRALMRKRDKMLFRSTDSLILAVMLRFLSAVLRSLTASYSSDTVAALAITGMVVHVLACDFEYARGTDGNIVQPNGPLWPATKKERSNFRGGIVSLNAALFSTTLLASRLSSNSAAYAFVSFSIVLFAFYPEARHAMACNSSHQGAFPCLLITTTLSLATLLLLNDIEKIALLAVLFCILAVSPLLKWWLQRYKEIITGPWDIVHITANDSNSS